MAMKANLWGKVWPSGMLIAAAALWMFQFEKLRAASSAGDEQAFGYSFSFSSSSEGIRPEIHGQVRVAGERFRIDYRLAEEEVVRYDVILRESGAGPLVALDSSARTYFHLEDLPVGSWLWSRLLILPPMIDPRETEVRNLTLRPHDIPGELAEDGTRAHTVELGYQLAAELPSQRRRGTPIRAQVEATLTIWTRDEPAPAVLPVSPLVVLTHLPQVDARLGEWLGTVEGLPVRAKLSVKQTFEHSPTHREVVQLVLHDLGPAPLPATATRVPKGFRYQEPIFAGVLSTP